jgi:branched-chain amino acid transport system substrate-binding protein
MLTKTRLFVPFTLILVLLLNACGASNQSAARQAPEKIIIGNAIALSGPNAPAAALSQVPSYDLWVDDVNAAGGIYVKEFDKKIPVEIKRYDDTSDVGTAVQLTEKLIVEDKVNFILPPWGTASNFAIAPVVSQYTMPTLGCTVGSKQLADEADKYPSFFTVLNQAPEQGAALVAVMKELGVKTVAIIHHTDLHGIEFAEVVEPLLKDAGFDIVLNKTYPPGASDLSQLLREAMDANPDAFLAFSYPPETFLMTGQMREIGFNPKMFYATVGIAFPVYRDAIAAGGAAEGVMGAGTWNPKVSAASQGYFDRHVAKAGAEPDRWASAACYSSGQILQQAIEAAGTLDPTAVQKAIVEGEFDTILGKVKFKNHFNVTYPGNIGQWQNGEFVIIDPGSNRQAAPIFPKPEWPAP